MTAVIIALDVGGSSIKSGLVSAEGKLLGGPVLTAVDSGSDTDTIVSNLAAAVDRWLPLASDMPLRGVAVAIPGPFDYQKGISLIHGVAKFDALYGLDIGQALRDELGRPGLPIRFGNDAEAAILGEVLYGAGRDYERVIGITLGTGLGSAFTVAGTPIREGSNIPPNGWLYSKTFAGQMADAIFSNRGLQKRLATANGRQAEVAEYATAARAGDVLLRDAFAAFGSDLGSFLAPYIANFEAQFLLVLGGIAHAYDLFGPGLKAEISILVKEGELGPAAALLGAATLFRM